ncbi:MAG: threonine/serine dehydratase [Gammaproteobacteria bacterium]|nr:threonine/serine dehydratase [Gammaproteobacteria bacterium]MBU2675940.1 threonine/serine dehydratase [Gammaproteobacteria bacterium]NNL49676.1 threonine/serine dehydratase [Woeseiaceae bacterium]
MTPLLRNFELDQAAGGTVLLKPENLQVTGSFKIRGAYNLLSRLSQEQASRGVVAWSSGNHAQGVAAAGAMLGIPAAIVMPEDAPTAKLSNTRRLGGEVITYDRYSGDREAIARGIAAERGAEIVPSYDHDHIIAGQGTVGLEIADQSIEMGLPVDQVLICCGGGGLSAGSAVALKARLTDVAVHTVEPCDFDDTARSLEVGTRVFVDPAARSICDALQAPTPGKMTFEINRKLLGRGLSVSDDEVRSAMRFAFRHLKLVVEPGGAVALAAVLAGRIDTKGRTTAVVLSGGNVDRGLFAEIQQSASG